MDGAPITEEENKQALEQPKNKSRAPSLQPSTIFLGRYRTALGLCDFQRYMNEFRCHGCYIQYYSILLLLLLCTPWPSLTLFVLPPLLRSRPPPPVPPPRPGACAARFVLCVKTLVCRGSCCPDQTHQISCKMDDYIDKQRWPLQRKSWPLPKRSSKRLRCELRLKI